MTYSNRQLQVEFILAASNNRQIVTKLTPAFGWRQVELTDRISEYSLLMKLPVPWDVPVPHWFFMGIKGASRLDQYRLWGAQTSADTAIKVTVKELNSWNHKEMEFISSFQLAYGYALPYKYNAVHPLLKTDLFAALSNFLPDVSPVIDWYGRQTVPVWKELTYTLWYQGEWRRLDFENINYKLSDGQVGSVYYKATQGYTHDLYSSFDFPLYKGYITELPLFGLWNYSGGSVFTGLGQDAYQATPGIAGSEVSRKRLVVGGKLVGLFHPLRLIPLILSQSAQYDFADHEVKYLVKVEYDGLPSSYSSMSHRTRKLAW
jgi:hypothetical protein